MRHSIIAAFVTSAIASVGLAGGGQPAVPEPAAAELTRLVETERAFALRARQTNWRDAFLEFFADGMTRFEGEDVKARLRSRPAPPRELEFWWEPRFGDIAASGELGWLTGPARIYLPPKDAEPNYGNYTSIWKRQADGTYKVIHDIGVSIPAMAPFQPGFTRAPVTSRYTGGESAAAATASLRQADTALTTALRSAAATDAYAAAVAPFARVHRERVMPIVGASAIATWSFSQPRWSAGETRFAEVAQSADLGYTWGSYAHPPAADTPEATGYYLRIWTRNAAGRWHVVLDVTAPRGGS